MVEGLVEIEERHTKELLAAAIEEKRRRVRDNGIKYYKPLEHPNNPQLDFHKSSKKTRLVCGGNRSAKTVSGATEAIWYATGTHPYKKDIPIPNYGRVCCTDFTNGIEKVILPEIYRWMPKDAILKYAVEPRTMRLKNGSTIEFMSFDQEVEKFGGAKRHWIWEDEEPPQNIHQENKMRLLDTNGDMWLTLTPVNGMTWIFSEIYEKAQGNDNIDVFQFDTRKNPYIDKEVIEELIKGLSEAEIDMRLGGKFISLSGLVYKEFNQDIHVIPRFEIHKEWPRVCAIDPHPRNPTVVLYLAVAPVAQFTRACKDAQINLPPIKDDEIYIVYDEVYPTETKLISEICELMHTKEGNDQIMYRLIDCSANAPDPIAGRTLKEEFEQYGVRTILADKDINNGIFKVREKLQRNSLFFFGDVHNMIYEIKHYVWDDYKVGRDFKDPKEKPRKKLDHACDDLRYICASCPRYEMPKVYRPERKTVCKETGY